MGSLLTRIFLICFLLGPTTVFSTAKAVKITPEVLLTPEGYDTSFTLTEGWLYSPGDDFSWSDPDFDDSRWTKLDQISRGNPFPVEDWPGLGWFRIHLEVDSALQGMHLGLLMDQVGAAEAYLNGKLIYSRGKVSSQPDEEEIYMQEFGLPKIFSFSPGSNQVLAVRFSNQIFTELTRHGQAVGFWITIGKADSFLKQKLGIFGIALRHQMFITVMSLAFMLVHLMFFIFYPASRENLYFAVFTAGFAGLAFIPTQLAVVNSLAEAQILLSIFKVSLLVVATMGFRLVYALFFQRPPKWFWAFPWVSVLMLILVWYIPLQYYYYFVLIWMLAGVITTIAALYHKKSGALIISSGFLLFALFSAYQMFIELGLLTKSEWIYQPYLLGILAMLISISIYLARDFARRSLDLRAKLEEVHELSIMTLEQERQARQLEMQRKLLEADLAHQAEQLKEAEKLEKAHSDLKRVNHELQSTQTKLFQSEKMASLGQLVAGIAHEINTPIGAAGSMHDTLKRAVTRIHQTIEQKCIDADSGTQKSIQELLIVVDDANVVISSAVERVTDIIRRLRSFARLDEAELKTVDIHEGLDDTLVLLHHELKHGIEVDKKYGKVPPLACYPGRLNQVFLNLLINAVQAMHGQGEITIITKTDGDKVYIVFVDRGEGIPEEKLSKIFDPGYTTKGVGVGTGLGLSICYQIIEDHHGTIKVDSRLGEGTTFTIILPTNLDKILEAD